MLASFRLYCFEWVIIVGMGGIVYIWWAGLLILMRVLGIGFD
ncbi:hypothetical protein Pint_03836 [Pistacia integerrima]|uniref:Uncharacterized protein n=2 Tax=Pistacia TaxID=55512 RepID=A0ACC1BWX0_9ROSI|nr:hypothetical protein Pint_03836 [Pistacia integerrima]KAJ0103580.1 hypothetical protein Patl1_03912 [Pistacia atlantica]